MSDYTYQVSVETKIGLQDVTVEGRVTFYADESPRIAIESVYIDVDGMRFYLPEILRAETEERLKDALLDEARDQDAERRHQNELQAGGYQ